MKAGVRNRFQGQVWEIRVDDVMAQVTMWAGDIEIASVMTRESLEEAGFSQGDNITALVKAINVVLVK